MTNTERYCVPAWFQVNLPEMILTEQEENWFASRDLRVLVFYIAISPSYVRLDSNAYDSC